MAQVRKPQVGQGLGDTCLVSLPPAFAGPSAFGKRYDVRGALG